MNKTDQNWEDLRLILAIVQGKGLSGASRLLQLHHATILRRLNMFEQRTGVVLFHRGARGYEPTEAGEEIASKALPIKQDVEDIYRLLAGQDLRLSGTIRIATSDFLAQNLLRLVITEFRRRQPNIEIEVSISPQFASLTKRDADIAFRAAGDVPEDLVCRKIGHLEYGLYGHKDMVGPFGTERSLVELDWVGDDASIAHVATNAWRKRSYPDANVLTRFDSMMGKFAAITGQLGVGFLPHFIAGSSSDLVCLKSNPENWRLDLWILTHPDFNQMNRIKAFFKCAEEVIDQIELNSAS